MTWIMLSEFHRGVALVGVVGRDLTALSHSLLRRRFLICGMTARRREEGLLAVRANGIVIWNTKRLV